MKRGRKTNSTNTAIIIAFLVILLLVLGYATNLFAIFRPKPEPATWPKIVSLHIGRYCDRVSLFGWPSDILAGKVDSDYRILTYDTADKAWKTLSPPTKTITRYAGGRPMRVSVKPSVWEYRESGDTVYFRIDPDEENGGMPDLALSIKFVKVQDLGSYKVAFYQVHVAIIGTSAVEAPRLYKDTYFTVAFDSWYLLTGIRLNGEEQEQSGPHNCKYSFHGTPPVEKAQRNASKIIIQYWSEKHNSPGEWEGSAPQELVLLGKFVLAELLLPFDRPDIAHFHHDGPAFGADFAAV